MHRTLISLYSALLLSCSSSHPATIHNSQPLPKSQTISTTNFSPSACWQSFQPYLFDDDLYRASSRFQLKTTPACYQYAAQKAAIEKIQALREKTIERYLGVILHYENNPTLSYIDDKCKTEKQKMQQQYNFPTVLHQIYTDATAEMEQQFPWITESKEYHTEKQHLVTLLNAINTSLQRPYCDSNEFEADINQIK